MSNKEINTKDLKSLLKQFFEKDFEISNQWLAISKMFLFKYKTHPELAKEKELQSTLNYLKNVMERNHIRTLDELILYYEHKSKKLNTLFESLEETNQGECFALYFNEACTMYMKQIDEEHKFKNNCLYYLQMDLDNCTFESDPVSNETSTSFSNVSEEEIKNYVSHIEGNHLSVEQNKCTVPKERIKQLISN